MSNDTTHSDEDGQTHDDTNERAASSSRRTFAKALGISAGAISLGAGSVLPTSADEHEPDAVTLTVDLADAEIEAGETTTASFGLTEAPNGLVGFAIEVSVDTSVATVTDAAVGESFPDELFGADVTVEIGDGTATIRSIDVDGEVGSGTTDVDFGSVELEGDGDGETVIDVEVIRLEDDDDAAVDAEIESATLTVVDDDDDDDDDDELIAELDPTTTDVEVGESVAFHVEDTSGDQHWITELQWDFGDGTTGDGWWNEHTYDSAGTYTVTLTATDSDGQETTDEVEITVA